MKRVSLLIVLVFFTLNFYGQIAINIDGSAPDGSAMLDVKSNAKGVLIPRMTSSDRDNISSPATGLVVYVTDGTPGFYYYDGSNWVKLTTANDNDNDWIISGSNMYSGVSGNVGIGTTSPAAKLHIVNAINAPQFKISYHHSYWGSTGASFTVEGDGDLIITADRVTNAIFPRNILLATNKGNVGIDTTDPQGKLDVNGNLMIGRTSLKDGDNIVIRNAASTTWNIDAFGNKKSRLRILTKNGSYVERLTILEDGNVGIGTVNPAHKLQVGTSGDGTNAIANQWLTFSDKRWKTNIRNIESENVLQKILKLQAVEYDWKSSGRHDIGFIAQDVREVLPLIVAEDSSGYLSIDYGRFSPYLVEAVKYLQNEIKLLEQQNKLLEQRIEALEKKFK